MSQKPKKKKNIKVQRRQQQHNSPTASGINFKQKLIKIKAKTPLIFEKSRYFKEDSAFIFKIHCNGEYIPNYESITDKTQFWPF